MSYIKTFKGSFVLNKPLTEEQYEILKDNKRVWSASNDDIEGRCQWEIQPDRQTIQCNYSECRWDHEVWMQHIIDNFIKPEGYLLNGEIEWYGEYDEDNGIITIENNIVTVTSFKCRDCYKLQQSLKALEKRLAYLEQHVKYMPGGEGALEAKEHFLAHINCGN